MRQMTLRDAVCLEVSGNALVCGGEIDSRHAFNFLAYMLGLRGWRSVWRRVMLRRFIARTPLAHIRKELREYSDDMWRDRVAPKGSASQTQRYSVHYAGHIVAFLARHFGMSYEEAMTIPIPVFHQLRRAWYWSNGREIEIMDRSDVLEAKIKIAQAQAERMNAHG